MKPSTVFSIRMPVQFLENVRREAKEKGLPLTIYIKHLVATHPDRKAKK